MELGTGSPRSRATLTEQEDFIQIRKNLTEREATSRSVSLDELARDCLVFEANPEISPLEIFLETHENQFEVL